MPVTVAVGFALAALFAVGIAALHATLPRRQPLTLVHAGPAGDRPADRDPDLADLDALPVLPRSVVDEEFDAALARLTDDIQELSQEIHEFRDEARRIVWGDE